MNPLFRQLYKHKKTRVKDPNAPPAPTLLGQVKELKDVKSKSDAQAQYIGVLEMKIDRMETKMRSLENSVEQLNIKLNRK
jgi:hypothetical protein